MTTKLSELQFDNRFTDELPADPIAANQRRKVREAYSRVCPTPVAKPTLIAYSREVAELIGLSDIDPHEFAEVLGGNRVLEAMDPFAMCYGGHQFGNWAGQLGDGRAINLGEVLTAEGKRWTLQLKGAGPTPFSRTADGLAVLRSSVREFLCSEAMFHLGVPTTRALSLVGTGEQVERDMFYDGNPKLEPGAVVCRVAPSFVRFGNFELPTSRRNVTLLKELVDFTIRNDYPELLPDASRPIEQETYATWFAEVCRRTADMVVHWMRVGFVHGVMNTDNMSILGLTIDYGPYGWLEGFDPGWTPNTTDAGGRRYRFGNQPQIASWNLSKLANALVPLLGTEPSDDWIANLESGMEIYAEAFNTGWNAMMASKLGLPEYHAASDDSLFEGLLALLQMVETDMTLFYRRLARVPAKPAGDRDWFHHLEDAYYQASQLDDGYFQAADAWVAAYRQRLTAGCLSDDLRQEQMDRVNPKYVLRNYLAQLAIDKAEAGDYSLVNELLDVLRRPYDEQPDNEPHAGKRPEWARHRAGCSMLSCSS